MNQTIVKVLKMVIILELTHGLNGIRNAAKNKIQEIAGGRKDYKIDCLAAEFKGLGN
jgi:succinate dehydrogenase/fumarate reductase cytochrome b subunit